MLIKDFETADDSVKGLESLIGEKKLRLPGISGCIFPSSKLGEAAVNGPEANRSDARSNDGIGSLSQETQQLAESAASGRNASIRIAPAESARSHGVAWLHNNLNVELQKPSTPDHEKKLDIFERALAAIGETEIGRNLFAAIDEAARRHDERLIVRFTSDYDNPRVKIRGEDALRVSNGAGASPTLYADFGHKHGHPIAVFHELVHVFHSMNGDDALKLIRGSNNPYILDEARTVGLGPFSKERFSENAFREQIGEKRRTSYSGNFDRKLGYVIDDKLNVLLGNRREIWHGPDYSSGIEKPLRKFALIPESIARRVRNELDMQHGVDFGTPASAGAVPEDQQKAAQA